MTLLNPLALAWAAIAIPIVALFVLRIRRRRQLVPTLMFWDEIFQDTRPRSLWRRLRHWLSLLLQLAFAALLVFALAEPIGLSAARKPVHYVLILDQSASMQATDGEPTRFDQARNMAHRTIRAMRDLDQATVIGAGIQPVVACGRTHHQPTLHTALDTLAAIDAPADLVAALDLARAIDTAEQDKRIQVFSDRGGAAELGDVLDASTSLRICGKDTGNLAITGFAIRPRADNPVELQGMIKLANYTAEETEAEVRLKLDDTLHDVIVVKLAAGEERLHGFQMMNRGSSILTAELAGADALPLDNHACAVLPRTLHKNVVLVSEGNLFLESVIASHPWMSLQTVSPARAEKAIAAADIVVYDGHVPDTLPAKPSMYLCPSGESKLWSIGADLTQPLVSDVVKDSSLLRHVSFQNVTFNLARAVKTKTPAQAVMSSFENPLLLRWAAASPPVVLLAVDINQSDLPWRTAFPILMQNALNDLAGQDVEQPSSYRTGQLAETQVDASQVQATDSRSQQVSASVDEQRATIGPVVWAGVTRVRAGQAEIPLAFNLANAEESNLRVADSAGSAMPANMNAGSTPGRFVLPWWVLLTIAAVGLSTVEWCLHQRRVVD